MEKEVASTNEKKMNLYGPDDWKYYFHNLRKDERILNCRQYDGGSVMLWAGIGYNEKTKIKFVDGRMENTGYLNLIRKQIQNCDSKIAGENFIF